jgi:hypothetical protein
MSNDDDDDVGRCNDSRSLSSASAPMSHARLMGGALRADLALAWRAIG